MEASHTCLRLHFKKDNGIYVKLLSPANGRLKLNKRGFIKVPGKYALC